MSTTYGIRFILLAVFVLQGISLPRNIGEEWAFIFEITVSQDDVIPTSIEEYEVLVPTVACWYWTQVSRAIETSPAQSFYAVASRTLRALGPVFSNVRNGHSSRFDGASFRDCLKTHIMLWRDLCSTVQTTSINRIRLFHDDMCGHVGKQEMQIRNRHKSNIRGIPNFFFKRNSSVTVESVAGVTREDPTSSMNTTLCPRYDVLLSRRFSSTSTNMEPSSSEGHSSLYSYVGARTLPKLAKKGFCGRCY